MFCAHNKQCSLVWGGVPPMVGTLVQFSAILSSMAHKHFVIWHNFFTLNFGAHQHEITKEHLTRYTLYLQSMDTTKARYFLWCKIGQKSYAIALPWHKIGNSCAELQRDSNMESTLDSFQLVTRNKINIMFIFSTIISLPELIAPL